MLDANVKLRALLQAIFAAVKARDPNQREFLQVRLFPPRELQYATTKKQILKSVFHVCSPEYNVNPLNVLLDGTQSGCVIFNWTLDRCQARPTVLKAFCASGGGGGALNHGACLCKAPVDDRRGGASG